MFTGNKGKGTRGEARCSKGWKCPAATGRSRREEGGDGEALVRKPVVRRRAAHKRVICALGFPDPGARRFHRGLGLLDQGLVRQRPRDRLVHGQPSGCRLLGRGGRRCRGLLRTEAGCAKKQKHRGRGAKSGPHWATSIPSWSASTLEVATSLASLQPGQHLGIGIVSHSQVDLSRVDLAPRHDEDESLAVLT